MEAHAAGLMMNLVVIRLYQVEEASNRELKMELDFIVEKEKDWNQMVDNVENANLESMSTPLLLVDDMIMAMERATAAHPLKQSGAPML